MTDASPGRAWLQRYAAALDVPDLDDADIDAILDLAGVAAHTSERIAAPVACWLAATAGLTPAEALRRAEAI